MAGGPGSAVASKTTGGAPGTVADTLWIPAMPPRVQWTWLRPKESETEKLAEGKPLVEAEAEKAEEAVAGAEAPAEVAEEVSAESPEVPEPALAAAGETAEPLAALDATLVPPEAVLEPKAGSKQAEIRFAEDILPSGPTKQVSKPRKKKKKTGPDKGSAEDGVRIRKRRKEADILGEEEEY